jgi:hypothetical protein
VASAAGLAVAGPGAGALFAAGQSCYLAAASVLLVLGHERLLLASLLPVTAGAAATTAGGPPVPLAVALLLATVVLAAGAAAHAVRCALRSAPAGGADGRPGLLRSLPYALFGLGAGVLAALLGASDPALVVVLTLSMGHAEWLLHRFRSRAVGALRSSTGTSEFALRVARALVRCLCGYSALLAAGALLLGRGPAALLSLLTLGVVLWTALLLQAFALPWVPALVTLSAAAAQAGSAAAGVPQDTVRTVCGTAAAAVLVLTALRQLRRPTAHR